MTGSEIRSVAIVGGGTAGWMTAAALARAFGPEAGRIHVIEPAAAELDTGLLRDCEAALPSLRGFHDRLGIDEDDLVRLAGASFGLGVAFRGWERPGAAYFHPYGEIGAPLDTLGFQHLWLRARREGGALELYDYALAAVAARLGRFARPTGDRRSVYSTFDYGLHLDVARYVDFLRGRALAHGVRRSEGRVCDIVLRGEDGFVEAVLLDGGERVEADLFIDASGLDAQLADRAIGAGWEDWSRWLPCDRAIAGAWATAGAPPPYAEAEALEAGWRWRVATQERLSAGQLYESRRLDDETAARALLAAHPGPPAAEPKLIRFTNGRRQRSWSGNCVAIGLAAGVLEPIQSVGLHLLHVQISTLIALFPDRRVSPAQAREYDRVITNVFERARDLLALHYAATRRDEPFWAERRAAGLPEPVAYKRELFASRGKVALYDEEAFGEPSWLAVLLGQGVQPARYDPLADGLDAEAVRRHLAVIAATIRQAAEAMPTHAAFLARIKAG